MRFSEGDIQVGFFSHEDNGKSQAPTPQSTSTAPLEAARIGLGMGGDHLAIVHPRRLETIAKSW